MRMLRAEHAFSDIADVDAFFIALAFHVRMGVRRAGGFMERGFAVFAGVPYQSPLSRQQWEELWEAEGKPGGCGSGLVERTTSSPRDR